MSNISATPTKSDNHDGINVLIGDDDNSNNNSSSDEYETDSQASEELETDTDDDSSEEGEEEQWSLRVRLLSAVDLPPSLSPTVPLCVSFSLVLLYMSCWLFLEVYCVLKMCTQFRI